MNTYSTEVRTCVVRMVLDNQRQHDSRCSAILSILAKIGFGPHSDTEFFAKNSMCTPSLSHAPLLFAAC